MSNDSFKLIEEKALVRGSTRGLGRAIAVALAEAGANVVAEAAQIASMDRSWAVDGGWLAR